MDVMVRGVVNIPCRLTPPLLPPAPLPPPPDAKSQLPVFRSRVEGDRAIPSGGGEDEIPPQKIKKTPDNRMDRSEIVKLFLLPTSSARQSRRRIWGLMTEKESS
ncbi:hypothetical protein EYF80_026069 [Liparis tanakae]|uniref:Uncharacterized protein n=1 Tax=Liparis tanakae TaxID=230148 RepID=A0A4Z2HG06_9TELE|nr:hypothetical protein EYF80_026069 [Liparis tanakae]